MRSPVDASTVSPRIRRSRRRRISTPSPARVVRTPRASNPAAPATRTRGGLMRRTPLNRPAESVANAGEWGDVQNIGHADLQPWTLAFAMGAPRSSRTTPETGVLGRSLVTASRAALSVVDPCRVEPSGTVSPCAARDGSRGDAFRGGVAASGRDVESQARQSPMAASSTTTATVHRIPFAFTARLQASWACEDCIRPQLGQRGTQAVIPPGERSADPGVHGSRLFGRESGLAHLPLSHVRGSPIGRRRITRGGSSSLRLQAGIQP
jgi:hypothetical protein